MKPPKLNPNIVKAIEAVDDELNKRYAGDVDARAAKYAGPSKYWSLSDEDWAKRLLEIRGSKNLLGPPRYPTLVLSDERWRHTFWYGDWAEPPGHDESWD